MLEYLNIEVFPTLNYDFQINGYVIVGGKCTTSKLYNVNDLSGKYSLSQFVTI